MPKRRGPKYSQRQAAEMIDAAALLKGNALAPRKRSGASSQAAPTASPNALYQRTGAPLPEAYGPPIDAFRGGVPEPTGPVAQSDTASRSIAPRPIVDKFPIVIGAGLTFQYLSACQRTALTGYRMQWVDLAREVLERDPHLYAVVWKLILGIANGRMEFTPAVLPKGHPDTERAKEICDDIAYRFKRIRGLRQAIATLGWGAYYGVGAAENHYLLEDDGGWIVDRLGFIHSRRLSYPDTGTWDLYVWDQGQVLSAGAFGTSPTNSTMFGLRVADFPQKFVVFAPQISGDYPTREGIARLVLEWALSKRLNARVALQYLERFVKPWPEAVYNTADPDSEHPTAPREATTEDIAEASAAMSALGTGGLSSWVHPDSVKVNFTSADEGRPKLTFKEFLEMCNEELSKGAVGSTLTTTGGQHGGNRALGEQHKSEEQNIAGFLATCMGETLKDQLAAPLTALNHANAAHLVPTLTIHVGDIDAAAIMKLAKDGAASNMPVNADAVAETCGLPLIPLPDGAPPRRMMPLDVTLPTDLEPELAPVPGPNTAGGAKLENEKTKAAQPHVMPGAPLGDTKAPTTEPALKDEYA